MGSGPKPVTGYTTTGNVNTDQQFSGPMPWETGSQPPRPAAPPTGGVMPLPASTPDVMPQAKPTGGVTPMPAQPQVLQQAPSASQFNSYPQPFRPMPMMGGFGGFNPFGGFGGGFGGGFNRGFGGGYGGGCGHM